jgi:hypothetical protein
VGVSAPLSTASSAAVAAATNSGGGHERQRVAPADDGSRAALQHHRHGGAEITVGERDRTRIEAGGGQRLAPACQASLDVLIFRRPAEEGDPLVPEAHQMLDCGEPATTTGKPTSSSSAKRGSSSSGSMIRKPSTRPAVARRS